MIESISLFIAMALSMAVITSMIFNPRRLEALGYSLSILFFQEIITGYEDIFFICPQFPIYVSPQDTNLNPDSTIPDSQARGVYVDTALLLARCTRARSYTGSIADAFHKAYQDRRFDLFRKLDITSLEIPILEERKRGPTRHPKDLEEHVRSIDHTLFAAQKQVFTQARILFSSPRFSDQDLVILLATTGEYFRFAILQRDHPALRVVPNTYIIDNFLKTRRQDSFDLGDDIVDFCGPLVRCSTIKEGKHQFEQTRREEEKRRQDRERDARAAARVARQMALPELSARARQRSQFVLDAGSPPYADGMIERYYQLSDEPNRENQRYPAFFEPEPLPGETISSFAQLRNKNTNRIVFTGVIHVGSSVSDKFVAMIRTYFAKIAQDERACRA